ncbi:MAG: primosomal protein N' [Pseudomonadota bacterium]|mgnify:CR=1 FL=1
MSDIILRLAIAAPLDRLFDYLPPVDATGGLQPGLRVRAPFGRQTVVAYIVAVVDHTGVPRAQLKRVVEVLDAQPLLSGIMWDLLAWVASYYHHPLGEVIATALPVRLREGKAATAIASGMPRWVLAVPVDQAGLALQRAPQQMRIAAALAAHPAGLSVAALTALLGVGAGVALRGLRDKSLVMQCVASGSLPTVTTSVAPPLNAAQQAAVSRITAAQGFNVFLLEGVTGSGKTEVYLAAIVAALQRGRQALVLVPEISLTPQTLARFNDRLGVHLAVLHSGLTDNERLNAWLEARSGYARVVLGTRSAVFTPLPDLGLVIVDEEHDLSYKQQDGLRYSARDFALRYAQRGNVPVVLGSATPALESLANVQRQRYQRLALPERAGDAKPPQLTLLDVRRQPMTANIAAPLILAIRHHLAAGEQVLMFLNRRGYAPVLLCHDCGWVADCARCHARYTLHQQRKRLICHHCDSQAVVPAQCPHCTSLDLRPIGYGTQRLADELTALFPAVNILRIDRDTMRNKGALSAAMSEVRSGQAQLLVGTQMLAKGHDFPNVTLVAVLDADQGLYSTDFRATEHLAQLIIQVAGRAGRGVKPGRVVIQTHNPDHPLLQILVHRGYAAYAAAALEERYAARLPPYAHLALARAEASGARAAHDFLQATLLRAGRPPLTQLEILGPVPAPMERRAGRHRAQMLFSAVERRDLHAWLNVWRAAAAEAPGARQVRWSLDVDPVDLY